MNVVIDLNEEALLQRKITASEVAERLAEGTKLSADQRGNQIIMTPPEPSYRDLLQLVEKIKTISLKGIEGIKRVVIRKEGDEYVLYTEGSASMTSSRSGGRPPPAQKQTINPRWVVSCKLGRRTTRY